MRFRKQNSDGDFQFGGSQRDYWRDVPEAPAYAVNSRLLLFSGEWYQDLSQGTPYLQGILGKHSKTTADAVIQDRVTGTQGVTGIESYNSVYDGETRALTVTNLTINTLYGTTDAQLSNFINF